MDGPPLAISVVPPVTTRLTVAVASSPAFMVKPFQTTWLPWMVAEPVETDTLEAWREGSRLMMTECVKSKNWFAWTVIWTGFCPEIATVAAGVPAGCAGDGAGVVWPPGTIAVGGLFGCPPAGPHGAEAW